MAKTSKKVVEIELNTQISLALSLLREKLTRLLPSDFVISQIIINDKITVKE